MMGGMKRLASIVGLMLSIISAIFTIKLLVTFATNGSEKILYGGFGACVQTAQTLLYLYGVFCIWKGEPGKAIPGIIMFLFLFFLSLVGTIGFFATTNADQGAKSKLSDVNYSSMTGRGEQIDRQRGIEQKHLSECPPKWNKNCIQPRERAIKNLQSERADLQGNISGFKAVPQNDALYKMIAEFFQGADPTYEQVQQVKFLMFILYSLALDLTSVVLLAYSAGLLNFMGSGPGVSDPFGSKPGHDNALQARISNLEALLRQQKPDIEAQYRQQPQPICRQPDIEAQPIYRQPQPQPIYRHPDNTPGSDPYPAKNRLKNIHEDSRPGYNPNFHMPENGDNTDELQALAILQANPGLLDRLNNLSDPVDNHMVDNRADNHMSNQVSNLVDNRSEYLTPENILNYVNCLYPSPPKKDQSLNGKNRVVAQLGITNWQADAIHNFLKSNGSVTVVGTKTFPNYSKEQLLDRLGLTANPKQKVGF